MENRPLLLLDTSEVARLLPMAECIEAMSDALLATARGEVTLPLRQVVLLPGGRGALASMPAVAPALGLGVKVITVLPGNHGSTYPSHQGAVLLFGHEHGELQAIVDAGELTAIRSAAVSGVATRLLAREDASDLALLGSGVQARTHLAAMRAVRTLERVRVWSPTRANREAFAERESGRHGIPVEPVGSAEAAVRGADLVCTVTAATAPVLRGEWLSPGVHVNAVGASLPSARELDTEAVRRGRLFVDRRESTVHESGDYLIPLRAGSIGEDHIVAELGEILDGTAAGRRGPDEITLFKSLGIAIEDLAAARLLADRARAERAGSAG
ncbi:MAG TPA: ornithine cyclodeaminase family protein [Longimicrobiaceae bacterium]|nr:ornithine cyclodeaminase family protein [Longimicrobiaceae bacterium]